MMKYTKYTRLLIWLAAFIAFAVIQHLVPGIVGVWLAMLILVGTFYWLHGERVSWRNGVLTAILMLVVGWVIDYGFRHASEGVNDLSILVMAMIFGAGNAYLFARWWTRRHNRPLP